MAFRKETALACLALLFLLALFFPDVLFLGKTLSTSSLAPGATLQGPYGFSGHRPGLPFSYDMAGNCHIAEPNPYIIERIIKQGGLPAWNPHEGLGVSLIGNLNTELFNPLKSALNLFPSPYLQDLFFLLRLYLMGLFTYLFLRERDLSAWPSLSGASLFMLSGYSLWWINLHPLSTVMYYPAAFYFYERWRNGRGRLSPFLLSTTLAMSIFGGKIPDVLMGVALLTLYAAMSGFQKGRLKGFLSEGLRVAGATAGGLLLAAVVVLPFLDLYQVASPVAKAMRTGAASHTMPLFSSVSLWLPLFFGSENYMHAGWLHAEALFFLLPYAGVTVLLCVVYVLMNPGLLKRTLPFVLFSLILFAQIYGLLPAAVFVNRPILGGMNFIKYNSMLYFSLAVIAAFCIEALLKGEGRRARFSLALLATAGLLVLYYLSLSQHAPAELLPSMRRVLLAALSCLLLLLLLGSFRKAGRILPFALAGAVIAELFLYMPKDRPARFPPYKEPPYLGLLREEHPYRIVGDEASLPPLVSNVFGLYDSRAIDLLVSRDYYSFFMHLISFSIPHTNSPRALVAATSPWSDLIGIKYILSSRPLKYDEIEGALRYHVKSLRLTRYLETMVSHRIQGTLGYGFFTKGGDERFSFTFPRSFNFTSFHRVSEPFIFLSFATDSMPGGEASRVKITVGDRVTELTVREGEAWRDLWIDVSEQRGRVVPVVIEGLGSGRGRIVVGAFGPSPGREAEERLYDDLLRQHRREWEFLDYRGSHEGIHIYENRNVMERAFILPDSRRVGDLTGVIRELQQGGDFREVALVTGSLPERATEVLKRPPGRGPSRTPEKASIKRYAPNEVVVETASSGGLLVLSDLYDPGWKVTVNGREETMIKVFGLLRGVVVPDGRAEVRFSYRPVSFYIGAVISGLTLLCMVLAYIVRKKRGLTRVVRDEA